MRRRFVPVWPEKCIQVFVEGVVMPISVDVHTVPGRYWHRLPDGRIQCDLCPRYCRLHENQRGFCFVRERQNDHMVLTSYGRSTGFCIDPIEKKPLHHFLPGSKVLSFGTAGCNLGCLFCQNWSISKSREMQQLSNVALPDTIAKAAKDLACSSVAFTYNDPVIFLEYAVDTAKACHDLGLRSVAVTAGYIGDEARREFFSNMDAANVDLKGFTEDFYHRICSGHLQPVLDTLLYLHNETDVWTEITCLLIPEENDSEDEIYRMTDWILENLGPDIPVHFTAFHPDWKMLHTPATPRAILHRARTIALRNGVRYAYIGNVFAPDEASTYCHQCRTMVIGREWFDTTEWHLTSDGHCQMCGAKCKGVFEGRPPSTDGRFMPIRIEEFALEAERPRPPDRAGLS
jgi:pyruvate formate lyase activating enzyme